MKFTFGVLAYNHERMIIETLESIKYQIVNYGEGYDIEIIITDDCSKDRTTEIIENWLDSNRKLFIKVDCHFNKKNFGVVKNYQYIINNIGENNFKIIAGDDVFSSQNIFKTYDNLRNNNIVTFLELDFNEKGVYYQEGKIINFFYHMTKKKSNRYNLKNMRRGSYFNTPSTIYSKQLYNESNAEKINKEFTLFEDDPTWYAMIKNGAEIVFIPQNIVLYRIHNQSISNSGKINVRFHNELDKLLRIYKKDAKGLEKLYIWFRLHSNIPKYINLSIYINKFLEIYRKKKVVNNIEYVRFKKKVDLIKQRENTYYSYITSQIDKHI